MPKKTMFDLVRENADLRDELAAKNAELEELKTAAAKPKRTPPKPKK